MDTTYFKKQLIELQNFTKNCRDDMHEPDEQGIIAVVVGTQFDNAFGNMVLADHIFQKRQELVVILTDNDGNNLRINLANLIALARLAQINN